MTNSVSGTQKEIKVKRLKKGRLSFLIPMEQFSHMMAPIFSFSSSSIAQDTARHCNPYKVK